MTDANIRAIQRPIPLIKIDQLEQDIRSANIPPPRNMEELGRMSAEAVLAQYETAAREFETMGEEIKSRIEKLQASLNEANDSMKLLTEAAKAIREQGKLAHAQIEEMSAVTKHVRDAVAEATKKITG